MSVSNYNDIARHVGHKIVAVLYGENVNAAVECETCYEVLIDFDNASAPSTPELLDPTCDECSISSEDAPEWCGNCGNCKAHCADFEGCDDQCYCSECCSEGHCSCGTCNEPCTCA